MRTTVAGIGRLRRAPSPLVLCALFLLLSGCAAMELPEIEQQTVDQYSISQLKNGLAVAVHPLERREVKKYFGTDLLAEGITPLLIVAENRSATRSFLISRERVSLPDIQVPVADEKTVASAKTGEVISTVGVLLLSGPAILIGLDMVSDAYAVQLALVKEGLYDHTLSPGASVSGVVFPKVPESLPNEMTVALDAISLENGKTIRFEFTFSQPRS